MPRGQGLSDAQSIFLRALRTSPNGLAPDALPGPAVLRRWMRRPRFRAALDSVRAALEFATELQLSAAAARASNELHRALTPQSDDPNADMPVQLAAQKEQIHSLVMLMRTARRMRTTRTAQIETSAVPVAEPAEIARWFLDKLMWFIGQLRDDESVGSFRHRVRDHMLDEIRHALPRIEVHAARR